MSELTKQEELERARKSIELSEKRLAVINQRLPELEIDIEDLIVTNEIKGYKGRTIEKTQAEIDSLQREKTNLGGTVEVLKKKLPELEKAARIELASTETLTAYEKAKNELLEMVNNIPSLAGLKAEIENVSQYAERLQEAQGGFFDVLQTLNDFLIKENLQTVGDISIARLREDNDQLNYQAVLALSDDLIDVGEELNNLQYSLFKVGTRYSEIKELNVQPVAEHSEDGDYYRIQQGGLWYLYRKVQLNKEIFPPKYDWVIVGEGYIKPVFPEEEKTEFSPCGRLQITKKNTRWVLLQKNEEGHWTEVSKTVEKPQFPKTEVEVPEKREKIMVGQKMVYGENKTCRDPDKAFNE